jgi:hypothetical protein
MALPDFSRLFDLLKATSWQAAAIAIGCGVFLWLSASGGLVLPSAIKWIVPVVVLVGLVSFCLAAMALLRVVLEWLFREFTTVWEWFDERRKIKRSANLLNDQEKEVLRPHVRANTRTFYLSPFTQAGGIAEALRLQAIYKGLEDKGLLLINATDPQGKNLVIHIASPAWKHLKALKL